MKKVTEYINEAVFKGNLISKQQLVTYDVLTNPALSKQIPDYSIFGTSWKNGHMHASGIIYKGVSIEGNYGQINTIININGGNTLNIFDLIRPYDKFKQKVKDLIDDYNIFIYNIKTCPDIPIIGLPINCDGNGHYDIPENEMSFWREVVKLLKEGDYEID